MLNNDKQLETKELVNSSTKMALLLELQKELNELEKYIVEENVRMKRILEEVELEKVQHEPTNTTHNIAFSGHYRDYGVKRPQHKLMNK